MSLILPVLSAVLLGAHFFRAGQVALTLVCLLFPLLWLIRRAWVAIVSQSLLWLGALVWINTARFLIQLRWAMDQPWLRLAIILGIVTSLTLVSAAVFGRSRWQRRFSGGRAQSWAPVTAFWLTALGLAVVQLKVARPMLLLERFWPGGGGWFEIAVLATYAAWVTDKMMDRNAVSRWRQRIWLGFSIVFFTQLLLGLVGVTQCLMSGKLHLPVPALIISGPLFRGEGLFMPTLFAATLVLVGPAWCSYLCYIGAWDGWAATAKKKPMAIARRWTGPVRWSLLAAAVAIPIMLRVLDVPASIAMGIAVAFGLLGVGLMAVASRRQGVMIHCTAVCPIGLIANWLGKLSPFRLQIGPGCTHCMKCTPVCRYGALGKEQIRRHQPGITCTLCGDCLSRCEERQLNYTFAGKLVGWARTVFVALVVALHAIFVGVARI